MRDKVIAILETRTGAQLAGLIARRGARPLWAPALAEVPDIEPERLKAALADWQARPFAIAVFQTGVGTRALFRATDALGATALLLELLARAIVIVRGPKPTGELNARAVRIDHRARSPFTTGEVLEAMAGLELSGRRVLVQRYGDANARLRAALEARGAQVEEISTYRWALPQDLKPLERLLEALVAHQVDAVLFTSAVQVQNLASVAARGAQPPLPRLLEGVCVASIGPVCTSALRAVGVSPTLEADPPKLGPLVAALERYLDQR